MYDVIDLRNVSSDEDTDADVNSVKVQCDQDTDTHSDTSDEILVPDSTLVNNEEQNSLCEKIEIHNMLVDEVLAIVNTQKIKTQKQRFKNNFIETIVCDESNSSVKDTLKTEDQQNDLNIKIKCIKSENTLNVSDDDNSYNYNHCPYNTASRQSLLEHDKLHSDEMESATNPTKAVENEKIHTSEFICNECNYSCAQRSLLITHLRNHSTKKILACQRCHYSTMDIGSLKKHKATHAAEKHEYPLVESAILRPEKTNGSQEQDDYQMSQEYLLVRHERILTGKKSYACSYCDYRCNHKLQLTRHIKQHKSNKRYSCKNYKYKASSKLELNKHPTTRKRKKAHVCNYCN